MRFNIYTSGTLIAEDFEATDESSALAAFAHDHGITGDVKRDGGGLLYVGDALQGRFRARVLPDPEEMAEWEARYPGAPYGTPVVLAEAMRALS